MFLDTKSWMGSLGGHQADFPLPEGFERLVVVIWGFSRRFDRLCRCHWWEYGRGSSHSFWAHAPSLRRCCFVELNVKGSFPSLPLRVSTWLLPALPRKPYCTVHSFSRLSSTLQPSSRPTTVTHRSYTRPSATLIPNTLISGSISSTRSSKKAPSVLASSCTRLQSIPQVG